MYGPEALEGIVCNSSSLRGGMLVMSGKTKLVFEPGSGQDWQDVQKSVTENIIPHLRFVRDGMPVRPAFLCRLRNFHIDLSVDGHECGVSTWGLAASTNTFHVRPEHRQSIVLGMQLIMGLKSGGEVGLKSVLGDASKAPILVPYSVKMEVSGQIVGGAGSPSIIMLGGGLVECGLNETRYVMHPFAVYPSCADIVMVAQRHGTQDARRPRSDAVTREHVRVLFADSTQPGDWRHDGWACAAGPDPIRRHVRGGLFQLHVQDRYDAVRAHDGGLRGEQCEQGDLPGVQV
jgi:hypothetical protein